MGNPDSGGWGMELASTVDYGNISGNWTTTPKGIFDDIELNVNFILLMAALGMAVVWISYLTFYHSRLLGFLFTRIVAHLVGNENHLSFGSVSFSFLSGKVMVRDLLFANCDFSLRIQDGWLVLRFWKAFVPRHRGDDFSHSPPRVLVQLNGLEIHVYNRSEKYQQLSRLFGQELFESTKDMPVGAKMTPMESSSADDNSWAWKDILSAVKIAVSSGRIVFGNHLVSSCLVISFDNLDSLYTIKPPSNDLDEAMMSFKGTGENFRMSLVKSPNFSGPYEPPPRIMGEGFVIVQTSLLEFYFYRDESGFVRPGTVQSFSDPCPCQGIDFKAGKGTVISYGPWADRERDSLYNFFWPTDYQKLPMSQCPVEGQRRVNSSFEVNFSTLADATLDVLFTKEDITNAIHINFVKGSYVEISIPWLVSANGYTSTIKGQLIDIESSTSLEYRPLIQCETMEFSCNIGYPRCWNDAQNWDFGFTLSKATAWLVFMHKRFFQDLINDWSSRVSPDLYHFIPYTCNFGFVFKEFEVILPANDHNWIDTSSQNEKNLCISINGECLGLNLSLPFTDFQPEIVEIPCQFQGEYLEMNMFLPSSFVCRDAIVTLVDESLDHPDMGVPPRLSHKQQWHNITSAQNGWICVWRTPRGELSLVFNYHPNPIIHKSDLLAENQLDDSYSFENFSPMQLKPDEILVDLELGPSVLHVTGTLFRLLVNIKENYFGESQEFYNLDRADHEVHKVSGFVSKENFNPMDFRPIAVTINVKLNQVSAVCLVFGDGSPSQLPHPTVCLETLAFEMKKEFDQTRLQLFVTPAVLSCRDRKRRRMGNENLHEGQLILSSFQLRGHAMFSDHDLPLDSITVEYAWLLELTVGEIFGRLTASQLIQIGKFLEIFISFALSDEESFQCPKSNQLCQHLMPVTLCDKSSDKVGLCPTESDVKYKMIRLSLDGIDVYLVESDSAMQLQLKSLRLTQCSLHTTNTGGGMTLRLSGITLTQYMATCETLQSTSGTTKHLLNKDLPRWESEIWLECGRVQFVDEIIVNLTSSLDNPNAIGGQRPFLLKHDRKMARLWFMWHPPSNREVFKCGCSGGCLFFVPTPLNIDEWMNPSTRLAIPKVLDDSGTLIGYGQSILRPNELIVSTKLDFPVGDAASGTVLINMGMGAQSITGSIATDDDIFYEAVEEQNAGSKPTSSPSDSDSESSSDSYISSYSLTADVGTVNLYGQLNRPVVASPMLMVSYRKTLNAYRCHNWNVTPTMPKFTRMNRPSDLDDPLEGTTLSPDYIPVFRLLHSGLNGMELVSMGSQSGTSASGTSSETQHRKEERQGKDFAFPTGKQGIIVKLSERLKVFLCPLGLEVLRSYMTACLPDVTLSHPSLLLQRLFGRCSVDHHPHSLLETSTVENRTRPLQIHISLPGIDVAIFQCGVVEKIVRFDELKQIEALTPCCALLMSVTDTFIDGCVQEEMEEDLKTKDPRKAFAGVSTQQTYFQLIQIADNNNGNIGILKKKDSKIPLVSNWAELSLSREFKECLIMEGGLDQAVFSLSRNGTLDSHSAAEADIQSGNNTTAAPNTGSDKKRSPHRAKTVGSLSLGHYFVTIGLLETWPPTTLKMWPLYDIFFPSASAWLHVGHRFQHELSRIVSESKQWDEQTLVFLLTEAFDNPRNLPINPVKSERSDDVKLYRRQLQCCPSCLVLLILQNFCRQKPVVEDCFKRKKIRTAAFNNIIKKGLAALLSQWRERFSADKVISLPKSRDTVGSSENAERLERRRNDTHKVSSAFSDSDSDTSEDPGETMALISKDNSASLQNLVQKLQSLSDSDKMDTPRDASLQRTFDSARQTNSIDADVSALPNQTQRSSAPPNDLYSWMVNEQKTMRRTKAGVDVPEDSGSDVNPLNIPLPIYFGSLFHQLELEERSENRLAIFELIGPKVLFSANLESLSICIVEPKVLRVAETTVKVAHMEKPFVLLQSVSLAADISLKKANKLSDRLQHGDFHAISVSYHAHLASAELGIGFSTIFFLSQITYVVRAFLDTYTELKDVAESGNHDGPAAESDPAIRAEKPTTSGHRTKETGKSTSRTIDAMPTDSSQSYEWSARMLDIMAFYQRQQKREELRLQQSPVLNSMSSTLLTASEEKVFSEVVFGVIDLQQIRVQMQMIQMIIFSSVSSVQFGHSSKRKFGAISDRLLSMEVSLTSSVQKMSFNLSESQNVQSRPEMIIPHMQTVVDISVGQSQILLTRLLKKVELTKESLLVEVGPVTVDIPLHPGSLHGVVLRGTKNISDTLKELKTPQTVEEIVNWKQQNKEASMGRYSRQFQKSGRETAIHFGVVLRSLNISANLLPSLKAIYFMSQSTASGVTGNDCKFSCEVPKHRVTFDVKELAVGSDSSKVTPNIQLSFPPITAQGAVVQTTPANSDGSPDGNGGNNILKSYLKVDVEVGVVQHTLTTDLLNQILFIQEAFLRELNEILQKITADRQPTYAWMDSSEQKQPMCYSLELIFKNIQITATTPSSSAIRLETDSVRFKLSNCIEQPTGHTQDKVFGMAEINLSLILGQLVKPVMYEEVEPELQQFAYFKTQIGFRNAPNTASPHQAATEMSHEGRAYLVTLNHPVVFILPSAVDKALRLWLNYKNTYEFWNEQRQQIRTRNPPRYNYSAVEKTVFEHFGSPNNTGSSGHLFFQVTIPNSLVLCIPLYSAHYYGIRSVEDSNCALILSLAETRISVCSSGCFVSDGSFRGFCVKFVEDFDSSAFEWQQDFDNPDLSDLNAGYVPEGTYQICSKTTAPSDDMSPAEWLLNIQWQMKGIDINLNSRIAKMSSLLVSTLTSLTTDEDDRISAQPDKPSSASSHIPATSQVTPNLPAGVAFSVGDEVAHLANKTQLERSMNEQSKVVCDLVNTGAKEDAVEKERRKLQDLESQYFRQFRREMFEKLKDQRRKATSLKDRLGVTYHRTPATTVPKGSVAANGHKRSDTIHGNPVPARRFSQVEPPRHGHVRTFSYEERMPTPIEEVQDENLDGFHWTLADTHPFGFKNQRVTGGFSPESDEMFPQDLNSPNSATPGQIESVAFSQPLVVETDDSPTWESSTTPAPPAVSQRSAIDLYLDIKVDIESGRCHFRTNPKESKDDSLQSRFKSSERLGDLKIRPKGSATKELRGTTSSRGVETEIAVPGLSVRCNYASHSGGEGGSFNAELMRHVGMSEEMVNLANCGSKKGQFYMKMSLKSMPKETVIKPHMLDFLEETMAPLSEAQNCSVSTHSVKDQTGNSSPLTNAPPTTDSLIMETTGSFPVDVVLCFVVEPTDLRFTSEPISRVECLLRLPTLELAVTSRKSGDLFMESTKQKLAGGSGLRPVASMPAFRLHPEQQKGVDEMMSGGISVTASLSEFSLYIFHPYGTVVDKSGSEKVECRKDSLSLQVKSVTVSIARSRNLVTLDVTEGGLDSANSVKNSVRFSLIVDISEAFFKYDMRRLQEILSFPKAWYRRAIFRRLFLGDESTVDVVPKRVIPEERNFPAGSRTSVDAEGSVLSDSVSSEGESSVPLRSTKEAPINSARSVDEGRKNTFWDAVVVWAFNFSHLDIETNMGNTMGITRWITRTAGSQGHAVVDSRGAKNLLVTFQLGSSKLESKSGIVGGLIDISDLFVSALLKEAEGKVPVHEVIARLSTESRVEWMGSSVMVGSITNFKGTLKDIWFLGKPTEPASVLNRLSCPATVDTATVRLEGKLEWDRLDLMLTQSTVSDLIKIHSRLTKFFENEFKTGRRLFVKDPLEKGAPTAALSLSDPNTAESVNLYRHWQDPLELFSDLLMDLKSWPMPRVGVILYGEVELSGNDFEVALFYGTSLRAPKWAVFHVAMPSVCFTTQAQDVVLPHQILGTFVEQTLELSMGKSGSYQKTGVSVSHADTIAASICSVISRGYVPTQLSSVQEWFDYTFRAVLTDVYGETSGTERSRQKDYRPVVTKLLLLPPLNVTMKTSQKQTAALTDFLDEPVSVDFDFITDFDGIVRCSQDFASLYFLHELISSYLQNLKGEKKPDKDGRVFKERNWLLKPNIRLIQFQNSDTVGLDWLTERIGLTQRLTIPKWIQRGFMDQIDSVVSKLTEADLKFSKKGKI